MQDVGMLRHLRKVFTRSTVKGISRHTTEEVRSTAMCACPFSRAATVGTKPQETLNGSHSIKEYIGQASVTGILKTATCSGPDGIVKENGIPVQAANGSQESEDLNEEQFLKVIVDLILREKLLASQDQVNRKVVDFVHPEDLEKNVADLELGPSVSREKLLTLCTRVINYSVRTSHPYFRNQLYGGVDPYGLAGTWLSEALNTNQHTYEVAPFFIATERAILSKIRRMIGWKDGAGDGIFCPGGSTGNMYGIVCARYKKFPMTKTDGVFGMPRLAIFLSEHAHYSPMKAANWLGMGTKSVIPVQTDVHGRMIPEKLKERIIEAEEAGAVAFCVVATAGTTVLGAFDPLPEIALICKEHGIWLHVDACWGGSVLLSKKYRHLMNGVDEADSVVWNPHKMLGAPLQCSPFVTKHEGLLHQCNSASATYLFQRDKFYDVRYDTGDKSIQCGRKVDGFKLWTMWKARGDDELEFLVDNAFNNAEYAYEKIRERPGFRAVLSSAQCTNVCFWYIPACLRGKDESDEWWAKVEQVAPEIKRRMTMKGSLLIGYQPLHHHDKDLKNFFRLIFTCQPPLTHENVDFIIDEIDQLGRDLVF